MQRVANGQGAVVRRLGVEHVLDCLLILEQGGNGQEILGRSEVASPLAGDDDLEFRETRNKPPEEHYTVIEIRRHNRQMQTRTLDKIGDYLSSMYREDFRNETLSLYWRGKLLFWEELDDELLTDREGTKIKERFNFTISSHDGNSESVLKSVHGWAGVLKQGSRSKAGFSILHSGRVIRGWPDAWRPESLFGQIQGSNDLVNQRLVGEIHLDDFDVSHTKDDILWLGDEEALVQKNLLVHCGRLREIAKSYRKRGQDSRGPSEVAVRAAVDKLNQELNSPEMIDAVKERPNLPDTLVKEVVEAVKASVVDKVPETFSVNVGTIRVRGYVDEMSVTDPYLTIDNSTDDQVIIIVNASHPHWNQLKGADGVLNYLRHCTYDGIAEAKARDKRANSVRINPNTVKLLKDHLLRIPFEIEQNEAEEDEDEDGVEPGPEQDRLF
jgi:hypothetical protein